MSNLAYALFQMFNFAAHKAFIIGISNYRSFPSLQTPLHDGKELARLLRAQQFAVEELYDADKQELTDFLETMRKNIRQNDRVLLYYAGHGMARDHANRPEGWLIPRDGEKDVSTFVSMEWLSALINQLPCRHFLLLLDCCFSGAFRWSSGLRDLGAGVPNVMYKELFERYTTDEAWQVITSSAHDQQAIDELLGLGSRGESEGSLHSPFADFLFKGITGAADMIGDGIVTATELYLYLRTRVEEISLNTSLSLRQTPALFPLARHNKGEFVFIPGPLPGLPSKPPGLNPYKGLEKFREEDADFFFGRRTVTRALYDFSRHRRFTVVAGSSGSGKSSLVMAGLVPLLRAERRSLAVIRPDEEWPAVLPDILVIDQFEEALRLPDAEKFLQQVAALPTQIIVTVRSDFERYFSSGAFEDSWQPARFAIPAMSREELREAVLQPAKQAVLLFEGTEGWEENIVTELAQAPSPLPLLSYTLSIVFKRSGGHVLSEKVYNELNGVYGAISITADELYEHVHEKITGTKEELQRTMRHLLLRLIHIDGGRIVSRRVNRSRLVFEDAAEQRRMDAVIMLMTSADYRLLVAGDQHIEVAHESFLRSWPQISKWVQELGMQQFSLLKRLEDVAGEYIAAQAAEEETVLWHDSPYLDDLADILRANPHYLTRQEALFLKDSRELRRSRRVEHNRRLARITVSEISYQVEQVEESDLTRAIRLLEEAVAICHDYDIEVPARVKQLLCRLFNNEWLLKRRAMYKWEFVHQRSVNDIVLSENNQLLATGGGDRRVLVIDMRTGKAAEHTFGAEVEWVEIMADNKTVLALTSHGDLWMLGKKIQKLSGNLPVTHAQRTTDGKFIGATGQRHWRLWDIHGKLVQERDMPEDIFEVHLVNKGKHLLLRLFDELQIRSADTFRLSGKAAPDPVNLVYETPQHKLFVQTYEGGFYLSRGGTLTRVVPDDESLKVVHIAADGRHIITAAKMGNITVRNGEGDALHRFSLDTMVNGISTGSGDTLLIACSDSSAMETDLKGNHLRTFDHSRKVVKALAVRNSGTVITAGGDGKVRVWDDEYPSFIHFPVNPETDQFSVSPGNNFFFFHERDTGKNGLCGRNGQTLNARLKTLEVRHSVFSPDEKILAAMNQAGSLVLCPTDGGQTIRVPLNEKANLREIAFTADSRFLIIENSDNFFHVLNAADGKKAFPDMPGRIISAADGEKGPYTIHLLNTKQADLLCGGKHLCSIHRPQGIKRAVILPAVKRVVLSLEGKVLEFLDYSGKVLGRHTVKDSPTFSKTKTVFGDTMIFLPLSRVGSKAPAHEQRDAFHLFTPDGGLIATEESNRRFVSRVFDTADKLFVQFDNSYIIRQYNTNGKLEKEIHFSVKSLEFTRFSFNGEYFLVNGRKESVLFDQDEQRVFTYRDCPDAHFSADGQSVFALENGFLRQHFLPGPILSRLKLSFISPILPSIKKELRNQMK
ncbi:caspase family protein [Chitinophaga sp. GCM10012297]|uniref:Caspase family protein n=1 Tax=Chitinophaga chungangae TaxID=2821488 RepID=A0ABS3Y800_9BACT|nr:caspase family protein [Chitinophaga chungangae]MBO9150801.1 caspase family protein [Chitinophaga chungangae]